MKPKLQNLLLAATVAAGLAWIATRPAALLAGVGKPAPGFQLAGLNGQTVSLSSYRGKLVLVNFWATWCPECRQEFPALEAAYRKHRADGFEVLAPSVDDRGRQAVLPFVAGYAPSFTICLADPKTADAYGVRALPASFLVGPDGVVLKTYLGAVEPSELENDIVAQLTRRRS
jgi:peroxiredoxin